MGKSKKSYNAKKFTEKEKKALNNKLTDFFSEYMSEYEEKNKDWVKRHWLRAVYKAVLALKGYIEDPNDPSINWASPYCQLQHEIDIDWKAIEKNALSFKLTDVDLNTRKDLANVIAAVSVKSTYTTLFGLLTNHITTIIKDGERRTMLPREIGNWLENEVPTEKRDEWVFRNSRYEEITSLSEVTDLLWEDLEKVMEGSLYEGLTTRAEKRAAIRNYANIQTAEKLSGESKEEFLQYMSSDAYKKKLLEPDDQLIVSLESLVIDFDQKKAYFPINVALFLDSFVEIATIDNTIMEKVWEAIANAMIKDLDRLKREEVVPQKAFEKLRLDEGKFAIPSTPLMFSLIAMFAGKPGYIPNNILTKPFDELTDEEREKASQLIMSTLEQGKSSRRSYIDAQGKEVIDGTLTAVISSNKKVKAEAEAEVTLFEDDPMFKQSQVAAYIKKTFGPEGLRHLLGLLIGLDEAGRTGQFIWDVNEHLERLGYNKKRGGSYKIETKETALTIVQIFTSFLITIYDVNKRGSGKIVNQKLFNLESQTLEVKRRLVVGEKLTLKATEFWYKNAFTPPSGKAAQFTQLLKNIAQENHREHPITIYLTTLLAVFWRIEANKHDFVSLKVETIMDWCNIPYTKDYRKELKDLESELAYMKGKRYLGDWVNNSEDGPPSKSKSPLKCTLHFYPPEWLKEEFKELSEKGQYYLSQKIEKEDAKSIKPLTAEEINRYLDKHDLTQGQFAHRLGVDRSLISYYKTGKRKVSKEVTLKIINEFGKLDKI